MLTSILPRLASLIAQPTILAAGVATGIAVGAVGVGTGAIQVTDPGPRRVALYECPDSPRVVKNLSANQSVLVTARSADGQWLEIYIGEAGAERGWARAASLELKAAPESLPIAGCNPARTPEPSSATETPAPSATPSLEPTATPTPIAATATPRPTKSPAPTPTAGPTLPGPYLSELTIDQPAKDAATGTYIFYPPGCDAFTMQATISVRASDPDGIGAVFLWYQPFGGAWTSEQMDNLGGGRYQGSFASDGSWGPGRVLYYVEAFDSTEDSAKLNPDNQHILVMKYCSD